MISKSFEKVSKLAKTRKKMIFFFVMFVTIKRAEK